MEINFCLRVKYFKKLLIFETKGNNLEMINLSTMNLLA